MYSVRAGILMGFVCLFLSGQSLAQKNDSIPEVSHQDGLSRVSTFVNFGGPTLSGMGMEFSFLMRPKYSLDFRSVALIIPDKFDPGYALYIGPQLQFGAKTSRLIVGIGYTSTARYGVPEGTIGESLLYGVGHAGTLTLGYRAQHKHGFFFELDVHAMANDQWMGFSVSEAWSIFPWAGALFGYRIPSQKKRLQWRMEGSGKFGSSIRQIRREVKTEKKLDRELIIEDKELDRLINARDMPERPRKPAKPVRLDSINRNAGHLNLEVWGLAPWTLNYTYSIPFKKLPRFGIVTRVGAGYTRHLTIPAGVGIEFLSHNNSVSLNIGAALSVADQTKVFYYTGFIGHFNIYKGLSLGIGGYVRYNPAGAEIDYDEWNLLTIAPSGSIGYRFSRGR